MKELILAREINKILTNSEIRRKRYNADSVWLDTWINLWNEDRIRVGVIGVTSSGKSTLINALLGDDLLSVAVRPSSSQLVSCSYAKDRAAVVYFLNGEKKVFNDSSRLKEVVLAYSDEKYNQKNEKKVAQLELSTPSFDLGEDVLLVDSPGLDATGYEAHEKLTLETLLPTVDVVIFVTTVKSEIDKKLKQTLDIIAKYNCPVMIVQNMLDAVRPSVDGKKSASDVAKERLKRVLLAVEQSKIKNKDEVRVAQISAISAMRYRCVEAPDTIEVRNYKRSRYEEFVYGVKELIESKRPEIEIQRVKTIVSHVEELMIQEDKRIEKFSLPSESDKSLYSIQSNINCALKKTYDDIQKVIVELQLLYDKLFNDGKSSDKGKDSLGLLSFKSSLSSILSKSKLEEEEISEIKYVVKTFERKVIETVSGFTKVCNESIRKLNLPERDLWSYNGLPRMPEVEIKTKVVQKCRTVKKSGIGHSLLRFISFGFYKGEDTIYYTETVVDNEATRESAKKYIERLLFEYSKTFESWQSNANSTVTSIRQEIDMRLIAIKEKEEQAIDAADWRNMKKELQNCINCYKSILDKSAKTEKSEDSLGSVSIVNDKEICVKSSKTVTKIYEGAERYLNAVQKSCLNSAINLKSSVNSSAVIISNNSDNLSEYLFRFYQISKKDFVPENLYQISNDIRVAYAPNSSQIKELLDKKYQQNIFFLINGLQFHTESETLLRNEIQRNLHKNYRLFYVIQDFQVLKNGNGITEGIRSILIEFQKISEENRGMVLISDKNPVYSMAIIHAQTTESKIIDETMFCNYLTEKFPSLVDENVKKSISNILRS